MMFGKKPPPVVVPTAAANTPAEVPKRRFTDSLGKEGTLLGTGVKLVGDLKGSENVELAGNIDGSIELSATLVVTKSGCVEGDVVAENVVVEGQIKGDVRAKNRIELRDAAQVTGNLQAAAIAVAEG